MAVYGPDDLLVLLDGYNIGGYIFEITPPDIEAMVEDSRGFGDAWSEQTYIGVRRWTTGFRGRYDDALLQSNAALIGGVADADGRALALLFEGNTKGKKVAVGICDQQRYRREPQLDGLLKLAAEFSGKSQIEDQTIMQTLVVDSGAGATSDGSTDNLASSSNGGRALIQITQMALGGYTSMTFNLQESSDNGGGDAFATKIALATAVTAAPFAAIVPFTGLLERYTRVSVTLNGAGSSESWTALVSIIRD